MAGNATERINLVVEPERKERWEKAWEAHTEATNLSDLIRISVEREISGAHGERTDKSRSEATEDSTRSGEIVEQLRQMDDTLDALRERIERVEENTRPESNQYDLERAVLAVMPEVEEIDEDENVSDYGVTAGNIARKLGADQEEVRNALDALVDQTSRVRGPRRQIDEPGSEPYGPQYYWKLEAM